MGQELAGIGEVLGRRRLPVAATVEIRHREMRQHMVGIQKQNLAQRLQRLIVAMKFLKDAGVQEMHDRIGLRCGQRAFAPDQSLSQFPEIRVALSQEDCRLPLADCRLGMAGGFGQQQRALPGSVRRQTRIADRGRRRPTRRKR